MKEDDFTKKFIIFYFLILRPKNLTESSSDVVL